MKKKSQHGKRNENSYHAGHAFRKKKMKPFGSKTHRIQSFESDDSEYDSDLVNKGGERRAMKIALQKKLF